MNLWAEASEQISIPCLPSFVLKENNGIYIFQYVEIALHNVTDSSTYPTETLHVKGTTYAANSLER